RRKSAVPPRLLHEGGTWARTAPGDKPMRYATAVLAAVVIGSFGTADAQTFNRLERQVEGWDQTYQRRPADARGLRDWGGQLRRGVGLTVVLAGILGTPEYYQHKGATPRRFAVGLHLDLAGHYPTPAELQNTVTLLSRGVKRAEIACRLLDVG